MCQIQIEKKETSKEATKLMIKNGLKSVTMAGIRFCILKAN